MDCAGVDNFGCLMDEMGSMLGNFLNIFGSPASSILFIVFIVAFVVLLGLMFKGAISD